MKKQSLIIILLTVLMSMIGARAFAHDIEVKNNDGVTIYYRWANNKTELTVSYRGSGRDAYSNEYIGNVVIPKSVKYNGKTYPVTSINYSAFSGCSGLTSVTIPNGVTSILDAAFSGCSGLTSVTIPNSVTSIGLGAFGDCIGLTSVIIPNSVTSIGSSAFSGCSGLISVTIPNSVKSIGDNTFYGCSGLTSVTIPNSVTSIGYCAFWYCTGLTSVTIPNSVKSIGNEAFYHCSDLTSVTIGNSVTSIGNHAFGHCSGLTSITIPNSVTSIGRWAFWYCTGLTSVTIPNSVTSIGSSAFSCCSGLNSIQVESGNTKYDSRGKCNAIIETSSNTLVAGCKNTIIPNSVTSIGEDAFYGCTDLTSVTIPNSVTSIGDRAFGNCSGLTSFTIPNSVTSIGNSAFSGCSGLTSFTIGNSVTTIGDNAFNGCRGLTSVIIPNSVTSIGSSAFSGCSGGLNSIQVESGNQKYDSRNNCNAIIETSSNTLILGCENTIIPSNMESIGSGAFSGCTGLISVTIPACVTSIGRGAFSGCSNLATITVDAENKVFNSPDGSNAIIETTSNTLVAGCKTTIIPNNVTSIDGSAFSGCSGLISVTIPYSVTSIGSYAFYGCSGLTSVTIPNSVTSIDGSAFYNCSSLTSVTIPNSVTSIGNYAFSRCSSLTYVTIPNSVTSIGWSVFEDCNNLQYICLTSDIFPSISNYGFNSNCQFNISQKAYESGIPSDITKFATYSDTPMFVQVKSKTATSAVFEVRPVNDPDNAIYTVTTYGQTPGQNVRWKLDDHNYGIVSEKADGTLTMETQEAQAMSINKARLSASVSEPDDDQHYGFEWLRYDAPEGMNPYQVSASLYNSQIVGALGGLNPDKYYKYRPYYKSDNGTIFRGEWKIFTTGDYYAFFDPEVHTKEPVALSDGKMILLLFCAEGTEEILEKGFELIKKAIESLGSRSDGEDITKVIVSGNEMSATIEGLEPGTEYICRSYVKTASGTTYGEEKIFKTPLPGDANNDGVVDVADIVEIVNAKAGNSSASFNLTNADMDGNGKLTETDINAIVNKIMQK